MRNLDFENKIWMKTKAKQNLKWNEIQLNLTFSFKRLVFNIYFVLAPTGNNFHKLKVLNMNNI